MVRRNNSWKPRRGIALAVRRSALLWWTITVAMALLTATMVGSAVGKATRGAQEWGSARTVWVVDQPIAAGDVLDAASVHRARVPQGVIPDGALDGAHSPVGDAARVSLARGEIVLVTRLAGRGARGTAAMLRPGYRAVALPNDEHTPVMLVGDRVDVIATFDVGDAGGAGGDTAAAAPAITVASGADVLAIAPRTLTVAVESSDAERLAFALAKGAVTVVLRSGA